MLAPRSLLLTPPYTAPRIKSGATGISTQKFAHQRGLFGDHCQQHLRRAGRAAAAMFPVEHRAFGNTDTACERALRQAGAGPDRGDIDGGHFDMMDNAPVFAPRAKASVSFRPSITLL